MKTLSHLRRGIPVLLLALTFLVPAQDATAQLGDDLYCEGHRNYWKSAYYTEMSEGFVETVVEHVDPLPSPYTTVYTDWMQGAIAEEDPDAIARTHVDPAYDLRPFEGRTWCRLRQVGGRTDHMALVCSVLARADERGADLLEALSERRVTPDESTVIAGVGYGPLDPDAPLPWDFIAQSYARSILRRAYDTMMRRLT